MANQLTWRLVDDTAIKLGVKDHTRKKWRSRETGVPLYWRLQIARELAGSGLAVAVEDFDGLEFKPGRNWREPVAA